MVQPLSLLDPDEQIAAADDGSEEDGRRKEAGHDEQDEPAQHGDAHQNGQPEEKPSSHALELKRLLQALEHDKLFHLLCYFIGAYDSCPARCVFLCCNGPDRQDEAIRMAKP